MINQYQVSNVNLLKPKMKKYLESSVWYVNIDECFCDETLLRLWRAAQGWEI